MRMWVQSLPGLAQWVKDLALLQAMVGVTDMARIWSCCGSGIGWQLQFYWTPSLETSICCGTALKSIYI